MPEASMPRLLGTPLLGGTQTAHSQCSSHCSAGQEMPRRLHSARCVPWFHPEPAPDHWLTTHRRLPCRSHTAPPRASSRRPLHRTLMPSWHPGSMRCLASRVRASARTLAGPRLPHRLASVHQARGRACRMQPLGSQAKALFDTPSLWRRLPLYAQQRYAARRPHMHSDLQGCHLTAMQASWQPHQPPRPYTNPPQHHPAKRPPTHCNLSGCRLPPTQSCWALARVPLRCGGVQPRAA